MMNAPKETESNGLPLTRKQKEAISYLVGARSFEDGCRRAKLSKSTLYAWFRNENFKSELERTRQEVIEEALGRLKSGVTNAIDGLLGLVQDKEKWIKLRACEKVIDLFMKVREVEELEGRLEKIERIILEKKTFR